MNREEAAGVLSVMRYKLGYVGLIANEVERTAALDVAISYLLAEDNNVPTKQPDPITGMVPCGCGGKAIMLCDLEYAVACEKCLIGLPYAFDTEELARQAWNTSRGYTVPPRPGAIVPDAGEMTPNGAENA